MSDPLIRDAYGRRADEYISHLGEVEHMHSADRRLIERWSSALPVGPVIDAGCGPGHWAQFLHHLLYHRGVKVEGVDLVPEFIESARHRFPEVPFRTGSFEDLKLAESSVSGVLAWYSLIHARPAQVPTILAEFSRVIVPGGGLLVGFFEGTAAEVFSHAVVDAYYWSVDDMAALLNEAGFDVAEVHQRSDPGVRPHAAIAAVARIPEGAS